MLWRRLDGFPIAAGGPPSVSRGVPAPPPLKPPGFTAVSAPAGVRLRVREAAGIGLAAWLIAIFFAAPSLHDFSPARVEFMRSGDFLKLCANPFARDLHEPLLAYRIFPPFLGWLLGANRALCLALPYLATIGMLGCVAYAVAERVGRKLGAAAALLVAGSYAVTWPNCLLGYGDGFAHLAAAVLLLAVNRGVVVAVVAAGVLSDERFVFALPLVAIWHGVEWSRRNGGAMVAGLLVAFLVRHGLRAGWIGPGIAPVQVYANMRATFAAVRPWDMSWAVWLANVGVSYRLTWLFIGFAGWVRWSAGGRREAAFAVAAVGLGAGASFVVFDVARSVAFTWPMLPLALVWLAQHRAAVAARVATAAIVAGCVLPSVWIVPGAVLWWRPLVVRVFTFWSGS